MSAGSLMLDLLLDRIQEDANKCSPGVLQEILAAFPSLNRGDAKKLYSLVHAAATPQPIGHNSIVITAPPSFNIKAKATKNVVDSMIREASESILITGYSLSEYFNEALDIIIDKSKHGVFVRFFVNHFENQANLEKLQRYKGRFLKIYDYPQSAEDKMAALHAKVLSVDRHKTLITSANLSYHGQEGNIELGTLVESEKFARDLDSVFTTLLFKKVFVEM